MITWLGNKSTERYPLIALIMRVISMVYTMLLSTVFLMVSIDALIAFNGPIDPTAVVLVVLCNRTFLLHTENGADEDRHM